MKEQFLPKSNVTKQLLIAGWTIAVFVWYLHQFSPVFSPIIRGLFRKLWR